jgi:hypothetical protein
MVHNGIEYGLMASYAEGLNILKNANAGTASRQADAETAPLEHPEYYQYRFDLKGGRPPPARSPLRCPATGRRCRSATMDSRPR